MFYRGIKSVFGKNDVHVFIHILYNHIIYLIYHIILYLISCERPVNNDEHNRSWSCCSQTKTKILLLRSNTISITYRAIQKINGKTLALLFLKIIKVNQFNLFKKIYVMKLVYTLFTILHTIYNLQFSCCNYWRRISKILVNTFSVISRIFMKVRCYRKQLTMLDKPGPV